MALPTTSPGAAERYGDSSAETLETAAVKTRKEGLDGALFTSHVATIALGILGGLGAMLVLVGVVLTMLLLGVAATWIPAWRALKADPLLLLRVE